MVRAVYVDAAVVTVPSLELLALSDTPVTVSNSLGSRLYEPEALTKCPNGDLFIADTGNHRVRRIDAQSQTITTVLGVGIPASSGEGMPASAFPVDSPAGLACDEANNLFVTSRTTIRMLPASDPAPGLQWGTVDGTGTGPNNLRRIDARQFSCVGDLVPNRYRSGRVRTTSSGLVLGAHCRARARRRAVICHP